MRAHPALLREPRLTLPPVDAALWGGAVAFAVAWGGAALVARTGPIDRPDVARASHKAPTPTSGGIAALAGTALGLLAWTLLTQRAEPRLAAVLALAAAYGLVGALDDLLDFGARPKLALGVLLALASALLAPVTSLPLTASLAIPLPAAIGIAGAALWVLTTVNAVNFMDGANGVAAGGVAIALAALGLGAFAADAPEVGAAALAGAAASAGLLPANMGGRLFQGDAGALFSGVLFAGLALVAQPRLSLWFAPLALLPFLTDVLLTLLRRAHARRPLLSAHREHLYQRWLAAAGADHEALAHRVWAAMAACGLAAVGLTFATPGVQLAGFVVALALNVAGWFWLSARVDRALRPPRVPAEAGIQV